MQRLTSLQNHFRDPNSEYTLTCYLKVRSQILGDVGLHHVGNETGTIIAVINNICHKES